MTTRAKFVVSKITHTANGSEIELTPVIGGSLENEQFYKWTPYGSITLGLVNAETADSFTVGAPYYVDFTKVE